MLDLFLKNILNVAESKFSTAKHLHDVWRAVKMHIHWRERTHSMFVWFHERTLQDVQRVPLAILWFCGGM